VEYKSIIDSKSKHATFSCIEFKISLKEVTDAILYLKNNKATGTDKLEAEMLKYALPEIGPLIVKLFNKILLSSE
jgi:hypothetical protein